MFNIFLKNKETKITIGCMCGGVMEEYVFRLFQKNETKNDFEGFVAYGACHAVFVVKLPVLFCLAPPAEQQLCLVPHC
jgi:hypothetical protein